MSIQTPQAGPLRLQTASHQASRLGRIFKAGLLVQSFHLPNENSESQKRQVTCQRPNSQKARSLGHLLCHRPTGNCYFFLYWFLLSKMLLKSFHMPAVYVFWAKTLPEVNLLNSFSILVQRYHLFFIGKTQFSDWKGMDREGKNSLGSYYMPGFSHALLHFNILHNPMQAGIMVPFHRWEIRSQRSSKQQSQIINFHK